MGSQKEYKQKYSQGGVDNINSLFRSLWNNSMRAPIERGISTCIYNSFGSVGFDLSYHPELEEIQVDIYDKSIKEEDAKIAHSKTFYSGDIYDDFGPRFIDNAVQKIELWVFQEFS